MAVIETATVQSLICNEYFSFFLILISFLLLAKIVHFILVKYVGGLAARTKTDIDDIILKIVTKPVRILIMFAGLYFALKSLSDLEKYSAEMGGIFFVGSILLLSLIVSRILGVLVSHWLRVQKKYEKMPKLMGNVVAIVIYLMAFLMILDHFEIEISPLLAAFGLGGLAVGLALQNTLSNLFAGLHIISDRPINFGDYIEIEGGTSGFVEDVGWRSTRVRTLPNTLVIVPNSKLAESVIINYSLPVLEMSAVIQCGVAYGSDLEKVEKVTIEVANQILETVPGAVKTFEPFIRYHTFGDSNINFSIILRVEEPAAKYIVIHEFIKALKARYDKEGIEISWPVRKVYYGK
uniref:Large-conductance mechanosensitive channel MscMJLR n=1 Tax=Candidatus Methanophagaceae archaeon ANME-1 ERB6 TaxID=2759912 RepID=A0A7G9YZC9_9EURY|nr:large-conductance mechanosensitive channel MscMJLR [Methanosarcinales archaeon ANME-1 ERB6]